MGSAVRRWGGQLLIMGAVILAAGCSGSGGGGGGDEGGDAALACSATGFPISGCWYGNQVRIDSDVSMTSIAVAFDGDGILTGFEVRGQNAEENGIFEASGEATIGIAQDLPGLVVYLLGGPDFDSEAYIVTDGSDTPTHVGFLQSMGDEGWVEAAVLQKTKPSPWPPGDDSTFDASIFGGYIHAGGGLTLGTDDSATTLEEGNDNTTLTYDDGTGLDLSSMTWDGTAITTGSVDLTGSAFEDSRALFTGTFADGAGTTYDAWLVSSADGNAVALLGCNQAAPACNNGGGGGAGISPTFFANFRLTWQWRVVVE